MLFASFVLCRDLATKRPLPFNGGVIQIAEYLDPSDVQFGIFRGDPGGFSVSRVVSGVGWNRDSVPCKSSGIEFDVIIVDPKISNGHRHSHT